MIKHLLLIFALGLTLCMAGQASAAPRVDIYGPGQNLVSLALAAPLLRLPTRKPKVWEGNCKNWSTRT